MKAKLIGGPEDGRILEVNAPLLKTVFHEVSMEYEEFHFIDYHQSKEKEDDCVLYFCEGKYRDMRRSKDPYFPFF